MANPKGVYYLGQEFWHQVRRVYVEAMAEGEPLSYQEIAQIYGLTDRVIAARAKDGRWDEAATVARASEAATRDARWLLWPTVEEAVEQRAGPVIAETAAVVAREAVAAEVEHQVSPVLKMIQEHQRNLTDLRTVGEALLALGSGLLPASIESARSEGWTPAEVLRALNLGLKMQMTVVQHERLLHGLPTSYHASKAESDARVHIEGVDSILDALSGREGVLNLAQALKDSGLNIDDSIIDAEFSDEGGPRNGTPTTA